MNALRFFVPGTPVAKARARSTRDGHHYTPAKTEAYEKLVAWQAKIAMGSGERLAGPVKASLWFVFAPPASASKKRVAALLFKPKISRGDLDNHIKSVCDAMNGICYTDDAQIFELHATKVYGEVPGCTIELIGTKA
jgi:Holliday junction resolvase RusA-like endonuclease